MGNTLRGDDGLGAAVIGALARTGNLPDTVSLVDGGTPGLATVTLFQGYHRLIVVDAAELGLQPGEWVRFTPDEAILKTPNPSQQGTLHDAGLVEALMLGDALGVLPVAETVTDPEAGGPVATLRPEQLVLDPGGVDARVAQVKYFGHDALVTLNAVAPRGGVQSVLWRPSGAAAPQEGESVRIGAVGGARVYRPD